MVEAQNETILQPAARVEVAIEVGDFPGCFLGIVHQAHQSHVAGQDVAILLQLTAHELQCILPVGAAGFVEQHDRDQRTLASLDQRQHFQRFVQRAEPTGAEHQRIGFLDEEQFAHEEEMERQQILGATYRRVGMLFERQRDVQPEAAVAPGALVSGGHDAATGAGDDHEVVMRKDGAQLTGQRIQGMLDRRTR